MKGGGAVGGLEGLLGFFLDGGRVWSKTTNFHGTHIEKILLIRLIRRLIISFDYSRVARL